MLLFSNCSIDFKKEIEFSGSISESSKVQLVFPGLWVNSTHYKLIRFDNYLVSSEIVLGNVSLSEPHKSFNSRMNTLKLISFYIKSNSSGIPYANLRSLTIIDYSFSLLAITSSYVYSMNLL